MNGEAGKHLQSCLSIALVASWLYVGQEKEEEIRARGLVSVLAAKRFFDFLLYIRPYFAIYYYDPADLSVQSVQSVHSVFFDSARLVEIRRFQM